MAGLGTFTQLGVWQLGGAPSQAEQIYKGLKLQMSDPKTGQPAFDLTEGTHAEASLFARAFGLAYGKMTILRASYQGGDGSKASDGLPNLEASLHIIPGPNDRIDQRQRVVAAAVKASRGGRMESVVDALRTLLGSNFLAYRPTAWSEAIVLPSSPAADSRLAAKDLRIAPRYFSNAEPITTIGAPVWVYYYNLINPADNSDLAKVGEVLMVQPGNTALQEAVTVAAVKFDVQYQAYFFQATFQRAHDARTVITSQSFPWQLSTSRFSFVIVKSAAAVDPETRRKIDSIMARVSRGVSQWSIVQPTTPGALTIGPYTSGIDPAGCAPLGQYAFTLSP